MATLDRHAVGRLTDFHRRMAGQKLDQHARMGRIEMLDQNQGEAGAGGQRVQQDPAGVEPSGRRADRHDRKSLGPGGDGCAG